MNELEVQKNIALKHLELMLEESLAVQYDQLVDKLAQKIKDLIPGETFDLIVDIAKAQLAPKGKAALSEQIEKVSEEV